MNARIKTALQSVANQNGMRLSFKQHPDGLWEAFIVTVRVHPLWAGTLADMWRIAKGVNP